MKEPKDKSIDRYERLKEPFPKGAYRADKSRGFELTTIDAYHVVERLNEVFGLCGTGWSIKVKEWIATDGEIVAIAELMYDLDTDKPKTISCIGGKKIVKNNLTDAYKSALTNAISKGASFLGVGLDVYKGQRDNNPRDKQSDKDPKPNKKLEAMKAKIRKEILPSPLLSNFEKWMIEVELDNYTDVQCEQCLTKYNDKNDEFKHRKTFQKKGQDALINYLNTIDQKLKDKFPNSWESYQKDIAETGG